MEKLENKAFLIDSYQPKALTNTKIIPPKSTSTKKPKWPFPQNHSLSSIPHKYNPPTPPKQPHPQAQLPFPTLPSSHTNNTSLQIKFQHQPQQPLISTKEPSLFPSSFDKNTSRWNASEIVPVAFPSVAYSNTLFFKSGYNVQIVVGDNEPEDRVVARFRSAVLKAGIIQECKRRRFFERTRDKVKRKAREASKRYRKRRPRPKAPKQDKKEGSNGYSYESGDDNWDFDDDIEVPYC